MITSKPMIQPLPDPLLPESVAPLADAGLCWVGVDGGVVSGAGFDSDVGSGVGDP